jgi:hypothetical protein
VFVVDIVIDIPFSAPCCCIRSRCPTSLAPAHPPNVIDTTVSLYTYTCSARGTLSLWVRSLWLSGGDEQEWVRPISGNWRNPVSNGLRTAKEGLAYPKIFPLQPPRPLVATLGAVDKKTRPTSSLSGFLYVLSSSSIPRSRSSCRSSATRSLVGALLDV